MHTVFCLENMKRRDHSEDQGINERIIFRMDLREIEWEGVD
jgi:hypothetical protein